MQADLLVRAQGRWRDILSGIGINEKFLQNKHGPCPNCGGRDRFRWDNKQGNGTFFCSNCGAGNGIKLVMISKGCDYRGAAEEIEKFVGKARKQDVGAVAMTSGEKLKNLKLKWNASVPVRDGSPTDLYLRKRGIVRVHADNIRDDSDRPGMVARVQAPNGNGTMVHLTLLTEDGNKAPTQKQKLFMPGTIAKGSAVRLAEHGEELGIAEGIETALSAMQMFGKPVWAALNEGLLQTWEPPREIRRVIVYADADTNYVGQAAAYSLAKRLSLRPPRQGGPLDVEVNVPSGMGIDWNDVLKNRKPAVDIDE